MSSSFSQKAQLKRFYGGIRIYLLFLVIIIPVAGFFIYPKAMLYLNMKDWINNNETLKTNVETALQTEQKTYQEQKGDLFDSAQKKKASLNEIFPSEEEMTVLTRAFDKFFIENDFANNPLQLPSLTFGTVENNEAWDYSILPVSLMAKGSRYNFLKFLDYIENSGLIENQTRLMTIDNLSVNFETPSAEPTEEKAREQEMVNFTAKINAYFVKQPMVEKTEVVTQ